MGFIILETNNADLSYIIRKNPATAPHTRSLRKGLCIGWFGESDTQYITRFIDMGEQVSFPKNHTDIYDYLPYMQYCSPLLLAYITKEIFGTAMNQSNEKDIPTKCSITQGIMKLNMRSVNFINKINAYINKFSIAIDKTNVKNCYKFKISSENCTILEILQYCYILGYTLTCLTFGYVEKPVNSSIDKILKIMNTINVPYYIKYLIKIFLLSKKEFHNMKKQLEGTSSTLIFYGNTQQQRYEYISEKVLEFSLNEKQKGKNIHIVDIGCGEGYYIKKLLKFMKEKTIDVKYYAHDIEQEEMKKIHSLINFDFTNETYGNLKPYDTLNDMISDINKLCPNENSIIVIFSEVIEHIPLANVNSFMIDLLSQLNFNTMLITTPQKEFNKNYLISEGEFRHPDHKQEFTKQEFIQFLLDVIEEVYKKQITSQLEMKYQQIGDCVDGISMSQGVIINKMISN
jgi:hypothetical protein